MKIQEINQIEAAFENLHSATHSQQYVFADCIHDNCIRRRGLLSSLRVEAASDVNIADLKRECFKLRETFYVNVNALLYPILNSLADEYSKDIRTMNLVDVAFIFKDNKINFIKEVRARYSLGLYEAKMMVEGIWHSNCWQKS